MYEYDDIDDEIVQTEDELGHTILSFLFLLVTVLLTVACVTLITIYAFTH